jgi:hypothetical protein
MKSCDICRERLAAISLSGAWNPDNLDRSYCQECWQERRADVEKSQQQESAALDLPGVCRAIGAVCIAISLIAMYGWMCADQAARSNWDHPPLTHLIWIGCVFLIGIVLRRVKGDDERALL